MCNQDQSSWGARINTSVWRRTHDCPDWANRRQREKWEERGLILWDHESKLVTGLWAGQALQLLEHFRTTDEWKQNSVIVGEPATILYIDDPKREPEDVLDCQFELNPARAQELFDLLQRNESTLKDISEKEDDERSRALSNCYKIILGEELSRQGNFGLTAADIIPGRRLNSSVLLQEGLLIRWRMVKVAPQC